MRWVDPLAVLRGQRWSKEAALCAITHGQVFVGDRCVARGDVFAAEDVRGQFLRAPGLVLRLVGMPVAAYTNPEPWSVRPAPHEEQLSLL